MEQSQPVWAVSSVIMCCRLRLEDHSRLIKITQCHLHIRKALHTQYWKSLYPEKIKKIQQEIEHTCDELDYAGSFIYDEYPDKINLNRTGRQICERLRKNEEFREIPIEDLFEASGHDAFMPPPPPPFGPPQGPPPPRPPRQQSWLEDIVSVLLYQEIARRRCRRCRGRY